MSALLRRRTLPRRWLARARLLLVVGLMLPLLTPPASAQADAPPRTALKVCQDPNNLPFSNAAGQGIENRIAELFGQSLGLPVTYYSFPNRLAFIRNTLNFKLPGQDYPCDVVLGVPADFGQVSATKPYYRSTYALVFPQGQGLDGVRSGEDFLKLDRSVLSKLKIGVYDQSPATLWLARHDLVDSGVPYRMMSPNPQAYPGEIIEKDLAAGRIDVAVVWGPIAGYYAKRVQQPQLTVVPLKSEPGIQFDYQMAMGVRRGEPQWKAQVEQLIDRNQAAINAILAEYNVPVVDESYSAAR